MVHGHQDAVWGQSTGSVCIRWVTEHSRLCGARTCPQAPSHAQNCGSARAMALGTAEEQRPQTTSAWEEKASGVPQAPCLHSCRCKDRLGGAGTLHSPSPRSMASPVQSCYPVGQALAMASRAQSRLEAGQGVQEPGPRRKYTSQAHRTWA